jgi:hypothetical protein
MVELQIAPMRLSAKGFAEFLISGPAKKAQVVRNILKPQSAEAKVVTQYYSQAIKTIRIYHQRDNDSKYFRKMVKLLESQFEESLTSQQRTRTKNNLRALHRYMETYGSRIREIIPRPRIYYGDGSVRISASPDLAVREDGRLKLVKLGVRKERDNPEVIRVLLRVIYEAANRRMSIDPQDIVYFDIASAARMRGSHNDSDLDTTIENGYTLLAQMCRASASPST